LIVFFTLLFIIGMAFYLKQQCRFDARRHPLHLSV